MDEFRMNGDIWTVKIVNPDNPKLIDRTNTLRVATTDPDDLCVYLSSALRGEFLMRVFIHELGHCAMYSFHLMGQLHRMVHPKYWIDAEEWVCNFMADYGMKIFEAAYSIIGNYEAWKYIPNEFEKIIA